jgi:hypothetical protein
MDDGFLLDFDEEFWLVWKDSFWLCLADGCLLGLAEALWQRLLARHSWRFLARLGGWLLDFKLGVIGFKTEATGADLDAVSFGARAVDAGLDTMALELK